MMQFFGLSSMKYELASDPSGHSAIKRRSSIGACHMVLPSSRANLRPRPSDRGGSFKLGAAPMHRVAILELARSKLVVASQIKLLPRGELGAVQVGLALNVAGQARMGRGISKRQYLGLAHDTLPYAMSLVYEWSIVTTEIQNATEKIVDLKI